MGLPVAGMVLPPDPLEGLMMSYTAAPSVFFIIPWPATCCSPAYSFGGFELAPSVTFPPCSSPEADQTPHGLHRFSCSNTFRLAKIRSPASEAAVGRAVRHMRLTRSPATRATPDSSGLLPHERHGYCSKASHSRSRHIANQLKTFVIVVPGAVLTDFLVITVNTKSPEGAFTTAVS